MKLNTCTSGATLNPMPSEAERCTRGATLNPMPSEAKSCTRGIAQTPRATSASPFSLLPLPQQRFPISLYKPAGTYHD